VKNTDIAVRKKAGLVGLTLSSNKQAFGDMHHSS